MNLDHIQLIKDTVPVLRQNGVDLSTYFYKRMLKQNPELKNVFNMDHQSSGRQPRALAAAVLAYAENIENPTVLAKAIEHISTKHVSLNIQPEQYVIVGENLLHSISEVLNVSMESELIAAWTAAYLQLADILIKAEQAKYDSLSKIDGAWTGWREFIIRDIHADGDNQVFTLIAKDGKAIMPLQAGDYISVRNHIPQLNIDQPKQFSIYANQTDHYQISVKAEQNSSEFSVDNTLIQHYKIGSEVKICLTQHA